LCQFHKIFIFTQSIVKTIYLENYFNKWNYKRILQASLGIFLIYYYTQDHNIFALAFGFIMLIQALFNVGCFSTKGCSTPNNEMEQEDFSKEIKEIEKNKSL